jgi:hypothetical protein
MINCKYERKRTKPNKTEETYAAVVSRCIRFGFADDSGTAAIIELLENFSNRVRQ